MVAAANSPNATDFCASYTNTCGAFLNAIACPASQQTNVGCETPGNFSSFVNQCDCAEAVDGSLEACNSIIEYIAKVRNAGAGWVGLRGVLSLAHRITQNTPRHSPW